MVHVISQMKSFHTTENQLRRMAATKDAWKAFYLLCRDPIWFATREEADRLVRAHRVKRGIKAGQGRYLLEFNRANNYAAQRRKTKK
jgi:hypothetical protein